MDDLARIKPAIRTGLSNGGWCYDRYRDLPPLKAGTRMPVADLQGPGIIRMIHTTWHPPFEFFARGIVLEIVFDDAATPAVLCPLADFFGDGCNEASPDFTSLHIECAPGSYNAWFPMPFRRRAQVFLRNDTDRDTGNYSFVEWESLLVWDDSFGYFHATGTVVTDEDRLAPEPGVIQLLDGREEGVHVEVEDGAGGGHNAGITWAGERANWPDHPPTQNQNDLPPLTKIKFQNQGRASVFAAAG